MGFLTTVTIRHDFLGKYEDDPALLGEDILDGMAHAARECLTYRGNSLIVHPSHHADGPILYLNYNGGSKQLTYREIEEAAKKDPDMAREHIKVAKLQLKHLEKYLNTIVPKAPRRVGKPKKV